MNAVPLVIAANREARAELTAGLEELEKEMEKTRQLVDELVMQREEALKQAAYWKSVAEGEIER